MGGLHEKILCLSLILLMVGISIFSYPSQPTEASSVSVNRIFGGDRIETAVEISKAGWSSADVVLVARSDDFIDSLVAAPLAHQLDAPI